MILGLQHNNRILRLRGYIQNQIISFLYLHWKLPSAPAVTLVKHEKQLHQWRAVQCHQVHTLKQTAFSQDLRCFSLGTALWINLSQKVCPDSRQLMTIPCHCFKQYVSTSCWEQDWEQHFAEKHSQLFQTEKGLASLEVSQSRDRFWKQHWFVKGLWAMDS